MVAFSGGPLVSSTRSPRSRRRFRPTPGGVDHRGVAGEFVLARAVKGSGRASIRVAVSRSRSSVHTAVFASKSTTTAVTPGICSKVMRTRGAQFSAQLMPSTCRVTCLGDASLVGSRSVQPHRKATFKAKQATTIVMFPMSFTRSSQSPTGAFVGSACFRSSTNPRSNTWFTPPSSRISPVSRAPRPR